jgi:flagellar biosynthesis protein FliR
MDFTVQQLVLFLMVFARVGSLIVAAPVFGHQSIPVQIKVALALFLSFVYFPIASAGAPEVDVRMAALFLMAVKEVAMGLLLGFATGLIFVGVDVAGELIGFDLGLSMSTAFDPETGVNNPVVGQFLRLILILVFLLLNGHHFILQGLEVSYDAVPMGGIALSAAMTEKLVALTGIIFAVGLKLAAPVIVASFLVNVALAVLTRVAPQFNVFIVNFPLKIGVGLIVLLTSAPMMVYVFKKLLAGFEDNVLELVRVL